MAEVSDIYNRDQDISGHIEVAEDTLVGEVVAGTLLSALEEDFLSLEEEGTLELVVDNWEGGISVYNFWEVGMLGQDTLVLEVDRLALVYIL